MVLRKWIRYPDTGHKHRGILASGEEAFEVQGGKKYKSLAGSLGIVI